MGTKIQLGDLVVIPDGTKYTTVGMEATKTRRAKKDKQVRVAEICYSAGELAWETDPDATGPTSMNYVSLKAVRRL